MKWGIFMNSNLYIRQAEESDIDDFTYIKAEAYADDRRKTVLSPSEKPKWYDGEWYIGIVWIHAEEENSLTIEDFCILPEYQGKGYGRKSLKLIEELYIDNKRWLLSTPVFCQRNRHLYETSGFKNIGMEAEGSVVLYEKTL